MQEKGFSFEWKAGCRPLLTNSTGEEIMVDVHDNVPTIASPVISCPVSGTEEEKSSGSNAAPDTVGRERSLADREEFECVPGRQQGLDPSHCITHFPKDSRCDVCSQCKVQHTPHRKRKPNMVEESQGTIVAQKMAILLQLTTLFLDLRLTSRDLGIQQVWDARLLPQNGSVVIPLLVKPWMKV